ncbi:hypothetical protein [Segetibacter koreensis]|uniref:hypothetical protein n=1 Tax=Segetibacter koreensis TaxID=398037 RepID=UPI0012F9140C|nr:hypothetical protein [Segetibacter koreensis]
MSRKNLFILIVLFPLLHGCVALNEVNQYAATSTAALSKVNDIDYTFSDYCLHDCELQQIRKGEIDTLFKCECEQQAGKADEAIQKIHFTITSYLTAIQRLSDNKGFTYDVSNLTAALQQNPLLKLTDEQIGVYNSAGNFIATASSIFYRKKKLKQYIERADPVFQSLTETFIFLINNRLREQLRIDYETRLANISQMLDNAKNDKGFKQVVVKLYLDERTYYKKHETVINSYVSLLRTVQKGHHELFLQRNNLKDTKIRGLIKRYAQDAKDILASLQK